MSLIPNSELRTITCVTPSQADAIRNFMQGDVYCWSKNRFNEEFTVQDLMGAENFNWEGTPCQVLYVKHVDLGKDNDSAIECAGKDLGWLVKEMLANDVRTFIAGNNGRVATYRWVSGEP